MQKLEIKFNPRYYYGYIKSMSIIFDANGEIRIFNAISKLTGGSDRNIHEYVSKRYPNGPKDYLNIRCQNKNLQISTDKNLNVTRIINDSYYTKYDYYDNGYLKSIKTYSTHKFRSDIEVVRADFVYEENAVTIIKRVGSKQDEDAEFNYSSKDIVRYRYDKNFKITNEDSINSIGDGFIGFESVKVEDIINWDHAYFNPCSGCIIKTSEDIKFDGNGRFVESIRNRYYYRTNFTRDNSEFGNVKITVDYKCNYNNFSVKYSTYRDDYEIYFSKKNDNAYICRIYKLNFGKKALKCSIEYFSKNYIGVYNFNNVDPIVFMNNLCYIVDIIADILVSADKCSDTRVSIIKNIDDGTSVLSPSKKSIELYNESTTNLIDKINESIREAHRREDEEERLKAELRRKEALRKKEEKKRKKEEEERKCKEKAEAEARKTLEEKKLSHLLETKRRKETKDERVLNLAKSIAKARAEERKKETGKKTRATVTNNLKIQCKDYIEYDDHVYFMINWEVYGIKPYDHNSSYRDILYICKEFHKYMNSNAQVTIINDSYNADIRQRLLIDLKKHMSLTTEAQRLYQDMINEELDSILSNYCNAPVEAKEIAFDHLKNNFGAKDFNIREAYLAQNRKRNALKDQMKKDRYKPKAISNKKKVEGYFDPYCPKEYWKITGKQISKSAPGDFTSLLNNELFENDPEWNLDLVETNTNHSSDIAYSERLRDGIRKSMYVSLHEEFERSMRSKIERGKMNYDLS